MTTFLKLDVVDYHAPYTFGAPATHDGKTGLIDGVWADAQGHTYLTISGPGFEADEAIPASEITLGGTPDLYAPTLHELQLNTNAYKVINLKAPDGQVPAGWAVMIKPDQVYVAWGLPDRKTAETFALGFECGMRHFGSKM